MFEQVKKILAKQLRISEDKITLESRIFEDLGADSLNIMMLLMTIEEDYGIVIPDEELTNFQTVGDVVKYLDNQGK
ncbi:MAG: acyl carrier protein [Spirochaetales bacterium]